MHRLLQPFQERWEEPSLRPPGSLRYEVLLFGYPLTDPPPPPDPAGPPAATSPGGPPGIPDTPETPETGD
jgi:hypothetical protein